MGSLPHTTKIREPSLREEKDVGCGDDDEDDDNHDALPRLVHASQQVLVARVVNKNSSSFLHILTQFAVLRSNSFYHVASKKLLRLRLTR